MVVIAAGSGKMVSNLKNEGKYGIKNLSRGFILIFIFMVCTAYAFSFFFSQGSRATIVGGHITEDTTWTPSGNPYIVNSHTYVDEGVNLTIETGVIVKFDGYYCVYVDGKLNATGNEPENIIFTSNEQTPSRSDWNGIKVRQNGQIYLKNCEISYSFYGIYLYVSSNNHIENTSIVKCCDGVYINYCDNSTLENINITDNENGIQILRSSNITISNVKMWNISNEVISLESNSNGDKKYYDHNIDNCEINGKPIYYFLEVNDTKLDYSEAGMIIIALGDNVTISNCNISYGGGIALYHTKNSTIESCNVSYNYLGIYLDYSPYEKNYEYIFQNYIINNTLFNNSQGIKVDHSNGNEITDNDIISNGHGIYIYYSYYNWIYHNNFIDNDDNAEEDGYDYYGYSSIWYSYREGNYWDDYTGIDLSGDGIGDSRYIVTYGSWYNSYDYFPLISPWNGSLPPDTVPPHFTIRPRVNLHTMTLPKNDLRITFETSEVGYYEIIVDTDGVEGFNNLTDTIVRGNTTGETQHEYWEGFDNEGNYVEDGEYQIQIMIWDLAGNPIDEPYDIGNITTVKDLDGDGVRDSEDAFPDDPTEWSDLDGDRIGDNKDIDLDGDGVSNNDDRFPKDKSEWADSDGDGIGDNADLDDNGNGIPDITEIPMVVLILLIPVAAIYFTQKRIVEKKKENQVEEKKEEKVE